MQTNIAYFSYDFRMIFSGFLSVYKTESRQVSHNTLSNPGSLTRAQSKAGSSSRFEMTTRSLKSQENHRKRYWNMLAILFQILTFEIVCDTSFEIFKRSNVRIFQDDILQMIWVMCRPCHGVGLGMKWQCFINVLGIRQEWVGHAMQHYEPCVHIQGLGVMCWACVGTGLGHVWGMVWACSGQVSAMFQTCFGQALAVIQTRFGTCWQSIQNMSWGYCDRRTREHNSGELC